MTLDNAHTALKKYFGYDAFRSLQTDIIQTIYNRRDTVVLMPTGGGKSICYQIPALTLDGVALVVSPLIALMKDQVEGLRSNGVKAAFLNSTLDGAQTQAVENDALEGRLKILYVSPEKLASQHFQPLLKRLPLSLIAIDEAHCISSWGHDFRPEYTQLKFLKTQFPNIPIVALTATADKLTRKDIIEQLHLTDPAVFIASFDRPNLTLTVRPGQKRLEQIIDFLRRRPNQSGIIYCLARRTCEDLADKLNAKGIKALPYHAELPMQVRSKTQEEFTADRIPVVCATIAFGMGIDKSNVRFVIHYNLPRNLEGYYQEIGRAGRDGLPAEALLFFSYQDVNSYRGMIEDSEASDEQKELKIAKLNRMYQFAEAPVCRRKTVLYYFGESYERNCGNCDVCKNPPKQFDGTVAAQKALSALMRTGEKVGMTLLIDILRGSRRQEVFEGNYHQIKTYGMGREYSFDDWLFFISQMLHLGLLEIAYDDGNRLRVTPTGKQVLFEDRKVSLAMPLAAAEAAKPKTQPTRAEQTLRDELFERLRVLRRQVAQESGVPPYVVFSDATLTDMAEKHPVDLLDLLHVSGVGEVKQQTYGALFVSAICHFLEEKNLPVQSNIPDLPAAPIRREKAPAQPAEPKMSTAERTFMLYAEGLTVEEIATQRGLSPTTIMGHLAEYYEKNDDGSLDINHFAAPEAIDLIVGALPLFAEPYRLRDIFDHFEEKFSFDTIRWALAYHKKQQKA
jgi:ATP-dependent DNA helicase RecQ